MGDAESREGTTGRDRSSGGGGGVGLFGLANWPAIGRGGNIVSISEIEQKVWVGVG